MKNIIKTRKNKILLTLTVFLFAVCNNIMAQKEPLSTFLYKGNKGLAPQCCLYKIDNKTREEYKSGFLAFGYNKTHKIGGFNIEIAPGKHTFEIVLTDKGVTSNAKHIIAKKLTLDMKADYEYQMERNDFEIKVICSSNKTENINYTIEDIPVLAEPSEQFATIVYEPAKKAEINPYISRIDDMVTSSLGDISGTCNYSLPVDFKYFSSPKGNLNLKIPAGTHKIEYLLLGSAVFDGLVQVENYNFEASKVYTLVLEETKVKREIKYSIKFIAK